MKVSIIIPVYKVEKYIIRCLTSVSKQSYGNIECIIVDDCTPDISMKLVYNFIENYHGDVCFTIVSHNVNRGLSAARNTGIRNATGDYIYFLDSDDELYSSDSIYKMIELGKKYNADIVVGEFMLMGGRKISSNLNKVSVYVTNNNARSCYLRGCFYLTACNKLVKKSLIIDNQVYFFEGIVHEDFHWSFLISKYLQSVVVCYDHTYKYYINTGSITSSETMKDVISFDRIVKNMLSNVSLNNLRIESNFISFVTIQLFIIILKWNLLEKEKLRKMIIEMRRACLGLFLCSILTINLKTLYRIIPLYCSYNIFSHYLKNKIMKEQS